jgi:hypothetical protein
LYSQFFGISEISRQTGFDRKTVRKYLRLKTLPEPQKRSGRRSPQFISADLQMLRKKLDNLNINKSYGEWGELIKDHIIAAAVLDRILHNCTTINIKKESYRPKERKKQGIKRKYVPVISKSS